jgi:Transposase IS116/IS110/IS902 family
MLADGLDYVIGVDTHRGQHTLAVVAAATGVVLAQTVVRAPARDQRSRPARTRDRRTRAGARFGAAGRTRRRPDRRRAADRHRVTQRPRPLRSGLRAARRRRTLPASSGQTILHRLSRGGDRQLNRALHTVVLHRRQHDPATRDYIARRVAEGKTTRGGDPHPQALPRPPPLPATRTRTAASDLTDIKASLAQPSATGAVGHGFLEFDVEEQPFWRLHDRRGP